MYMLDQTLFSTGLFTLGLQVIVFLHLASPNLSIFNSPCMLSVYSMSRQVILTGMAITFSLIHQIAVVVHNILYLLRNKTFFQCLISLLGAKELIRSSSLINLIFLGTMNWLL